MKAKFFSIFLFFVFFNSFSFAEVVDEHKELKGPFATPEEVTATCIECHDEAAEDFMKTRHWRWEGSEFELHGKKIKLGKKTIFNNFCININSNEPRCTSCHAGYGWKDKDFDFSNSEKIDCLVCHDQTGTYKKFPTAAGYPVYKEKEKFFKGDKKTYKRPDFVKIAQNVGNPKNENCGACHFCGGGGNCVKHGDMDSSLNKPTDDIDVHMGKYNMSCIDCHGDEKHHIKGALYASMAAGVNHFECTECHKEKNFHKAKKIKMGSLIDKHAKSVACETCHIPKVAKSYATKIWWDWTTAGDKKRKVEKDENNQPLYSWKKGDFKWKKNMTPEYYWHNGKTDYYLLGEEIKDPSKLLIFNKLEGTFKDKKSKISPFKVMRGKQYYDSKTKKLLAPKLFGKGGYWETLDWDKAFTAGMKSVGLKYSGSYAPIETEMYWPVFHMVATKEKALGGKENRCSVCHAKQGKKGLMDWKALGYSGDPKKKDHNSRIKQGIVKK